MGTIAEAMNFGSHVTINGTLYVSSFTVPADTIYNSMVNPNAEIARSKLALDSLKPYEIPVTAFRVWDARATNLPAAAANDDLGLVTGTLGTNIPMLQTSDAGGVHGRTEYAGLLYPLPAEYAAGETVTFRIRGACITNVPDQASTIDVEVYERDVDAGIQGGPDTDICTTAAQDYTAAGAGVYANFDFTITPTTLVAGDLLDIRIALFTDDDGDAGAMYFAMPKFAMLLDVRG